MNDNEVKNAFDHIETEPGAQERMYANILKKAAAQREDQNAEENIEEKQPTVQKRKTIPMWRRWGSLAACLAIVIVAGFAFPHFFDRSEPDDPPAVSYTHLRRGKRRRKAASSKQYDISHRSAQ